MSAVVARSAPTRTRKWLVEGTVAAVLLLALGGYAGLRSPWGAKHASVVEGTAMRAGGGDDLVLFDGAEGTQIDFAAEEIWWTSERAEGQGDPPCLRTPQKKVNVEVGLMWVARPEGGSFQQAVWVRCP